MHINNLRPNLSNWTRKKLTEQAIQVQRDDALLPEVAAHVVVSDREEGGANPYAKK